MTQHLPDWLTLDRSDATARALADTQLLIVVGVTGVGKSTTVEALADAGLAFDLLPNRRTLTDLLIIPAVQAANHQLIEAVRDRGARFALTKRYRDMHAGGMAHALAQLGVTSAEKWLIFDGLRGANEVTHAAQLLPNAQFLVLDAPHIVRLQRLLGRGDAFDQIASSTDNNGSLRMQLAQTADGMFEQDALNQLTGWVTAGDVSAEALQTKLQIVVAERNNYDPTATIAALRRVAPSRSHIYDTASLSPDQIASDLITKLAK